MPRLSRVYGRPFVSIFFLACLHLSLFSSEVFADELIFESCEVSLKGTAINRKLSCASIQSELYPGSDEKINISITRLKARSKKPELDPVLMLAGGPGQAASEAYLFADKRYRQMSETRDIYLIDQRGTGGSTLFACEEMETALLEASGLPDDYSSMVESCLEKFEYDARYFTTSAALDDFELVRKTLGITQWNLIGVSYGTRVAQHYLRRHPDSVRSVVLDSVVAPNHNLGSEVAIQSQVALEQLISSCHAQVECQKAFPNLSAAVKDVLAQLRRESVPVSYEDIRTGEVIESRFTIYHLAMVLRMSLYTDEAYALIPLLIHQAYEYNNFSPLARKARSISEKMNGVMALGMHNSVMCAEDNPYFSENELNNPETERSYMGRELIEFLRGICEVWPVGVVDEDFKRLVKSNKPVLLFSGENDPITPPSYADEAANNLTNSRHFILKGQAHNVSATGCAPTLVAKFMNELNPKKLNGTCLNRIEASPFFIDFNGPSP